MLFGYATSREGAPILIKVYDQADDWQVISAQGGERWFTKHCHTPWQESFNLAVSTYCDQSHLTAPTSWENAGQ